MGCLGQGAVMTRGRSGLATTEPGKVLRLSSLASGRANWSSGNILTTHFQCAFLCFLSPGPGNCWQTIHPSIHFITCHQLLSVRKKKYGPAGASASCYVLSEQGGHAVDAAAVAGPSNRPEGVLTFLHVLESSCGPWPDLGHPARYRYSDSSGTCTDWTLVACSGGNHRATEPDDIRG